MDDTASTPPLWSLQGTIAKLRCGELSGEVDVSRPHVGLHQPAFDHERVPCLFFCTHRTPELRATSDPTRNGDSLWWPLDVADAYIRGNDLVASYRATDDWPYSPQLYWQGNMFQSVEGVLGSMSHMVSVQTHLLDTHPKIDITSQVPCSEYLYITIDDDGAATVEPANRERTIVPTATMCCVLWRLLAAPLSYIEIVATTDVREIAFGPAGSGRLFAAWRLFAEFLEKGVIRRARVHGALLPQENDVELALECCRAVERCPLPLTA